ncbi:MAG: branched-chain amino acid ABC transporter permease [Dehalococcoidales bacterium]|nr:branched-chain amino acid ABC transporter permease [Dehalococcoidales bacterium]
MSVSLFFQLLANGLMAGGMYALVASGLTLTMGVLKIFNFAQGQFYMLGAFIAFGVTVSLGLPYPIAILIALLTMALLGVLFYFGLLHKTMAHGFFNTMLITIYFSTIIGQISLLTFAQQEKAVPTVVPGSLNIGDVTFNNGKLLVIGCAIILLVALYYFMKTKIGTAMLAAAENKDVASLQGINATQIFWVTMAVGCALSGIGGAIIAPVSGAYLMMGQNVFMRALLVLMVGGMGSMSGALVAAFLIGIVESFAFQYVGYLNLVVLLVFVGVLMYFRPGGLMGKPMPIPGE